MLFSSKKLSKKLFGGVALALIIAVPLSAGFVGGSGRGSGGGSSGAYTNEIDKKAQDNGYYTDAERDAAIVKGYSGTSSNDADIYNAAKGRVSSSFPSPHNLTDGNSSPIGSNHYESDCDDYILLNSSVTGTGCADLTKTQFQAVRGDTDAATNAGFDDNVQYKNANLLGYTKACADSDLYLESLGRSTSACFATALSPPSGSDCTTYISENSLTDTSNVALTGCNKLSKSQYNAFKSWNDVQAAQTAILGASACSGITKQNIKLFMNDQSVSNADFDFDNLTVKQTDFLKQCILDTGASRTIAQAKSCGSAKDDGDLALYEVQQIRAAGAAGCGVAADYPTTALTTALLGRADVWASANDASCSSAYGGNFCETSGSTVSCNSILQSDISSATVSNVSSAANIASWASGKIKTNLVAQWNAWTPPHVIVEACQSVSWAAPSFLQSPALKPSYSTWEFNAMVAAPASNIYVTGGTISSPYSYKNMLLMGQDGTDFRVEIAANVEKRRMRNVQSTLYYTNSCPAFGTSYAGSTKKIPLSVVKNTVDATANPLTSVFKPVQVEHTGYLCNACQGDNPPEYCDAALSLGTGNYWHRNNTQVASSSNGNLVCTGKSFSTNAGGADWSQPVGVSNVIKCVNAGCGTGQPDTYDTSIRCQAPKPYHNNYAPNASITLGAASGVKKSLTASGTVSEAGTMHVEWCDGTRQSVATTASGAVHSWSISSAAPQATSLSHIRLDTSDAIGVTAQVNNIGFSSACPN